MSAFARFAFAGLLLGAGVASLIAFAASQSWFADLLVNFRLQYLAIGLLALPWFAWRRHGPLTAAAVLTIGMNAAPVAAYFGPAEDDPMLATATATATATAPAGVALRIASANVLFLNHDHAAVLAWARRTQPDVLLLLEVTAQWRAALAPLQAAYPHHRYVTDRSHHGLLLLSRWPLGDVVTRPPEQRLLRPALFATVTKQGLPVRVAAMHATWPIRPRDAAQRSRDLAALAAEANRRGTLPFIGIGDLNISPFSPHFHTLLRDGGLRSAAAGRGWQPTWPAMFAPLGIQIDHALLSPEVHVQAFQRGTANGSDHRPIIIDVTIPSRNLLLSHQ